MYNICLVGSGGVGTIASLVLEKSKQASVTSVLRSNYMVVAEKGFDIDSVDHGKLTAWKPCKVVSSIEEAAQQGAYDYVVVTVKALPDVYSVPEMIQKLVKPGLTTIVLIQNGLDIELPVLKAFPENTVMSGVSMIGSRAYENKVYHEDPDDVIFGCHYQSDLAKELQIVKTKSFVEIYSNGGAAKCVFVDDIAFFRWRKLLWNGTFNTLCTLTRLDVGALQKGGGTETLLRPAMWEMYAIAKGAGFMFPQDFIDDLVRGTPLESPFRPSMLVDLEKGNPLELEVILGAPLRHGRELGIATPILSMIYDLLKLVQWGILEKRKLP